MGVGGLTPFLPARRSRVEVVKTSNRCSGGEGRRYEWLMGRLT